jgi:hypothetical protein
MLFHLPPSVLLLAVVILPLTGTAPPPKIDFQPRSQAVVLYQQAAFGVIASGMSARTPLSALQPCNVHDPNAWHQSRRMVSWDFSSPGRKTC